MDKIVESYIEITCPATNRKEKLWYRHLTCTDLFVCNGCDNCNGSATCLNCIAEVTNGLRTE